MVLTSNQSFGNWGDVFGDRVIASAILGWLTDEDVFREVSHGNAGVGR